MDDIRSEQTATAVSPVLADSVWAAAWGSTLSQSLPWIQWAALDFAQFGLSLTLTQENTESLELLRILWIPPEFFLGHFSIRPLSEPRPCCSLCIRGVDGAWSPLNACWQGRTPQPQPFRVGVTLLAPAFVWSSSLHAQNGYILGTFVKPVRIPLNPSFLQVVLLLNGKLSSVLVLLSVWFWTQLIEQPWHSPYFREWFLRDHCLFSPNHWTQISSSCPVFSWGVACSSLRFWSMFGAFAMSSKCLSKPVLLWLQRVWSLAIVFTPAPLITFALTHGMSEEFTAGMKLGSFPPAIIESWVTFAVFHKVYRTALVAVERVCSRVVLKHLGKHKIMVLGETLWVHCLSLKYTKQWHFYCSIKY